MTNALVADKTEWDLFITGFPWARIVNRQGLKHQFKIKTPFESHFLY